MAPLALARRTGTSINLARPMRKASTLRTSEDLQKDALWTGMTVKGKLILSPEVGLFREMTGVLKTWVRTQPEEIREDQDRFLYLDKVDWSMVPPLGQVAHIWDILFKSVKREVYCLIIKHPGEAKWTFLVPEQIGSPGGVTWKDEWAQRRILELGTLVGSMHSHPGTGTQPSGTDMENWTDPLHWGLHFILGTDRSFTICAASGGATVPIKEGSFTGVVRERVRYERSQGKTLRQLLLVPPPIKTPKARGRRLGGYWPAPKRKTESIGGLDHFVAFFQTQVPHLAIDRDSFEKSGYDMTLVEVDGDLFMIGKGMVDLIQAHMDKEGYLKPLMNFRIPPETSKSPRKEGSHGRV